MSLISIIPVCPETLNSLRQPKVSKLAVSPILTEVTGQEFSSLNNSTVLLPDERVAIQREFNHLFDLLFDEVNLLRDLFDYYEDSCIDLRNMLGRPLKELVYRASKDGWSNQTFHECADNRGPTVTIVQLKNGRFIGGFTEGSWHSAGGTADSGAGSFLFLFGANVASVCLPAMSKSSAPYQRYGMGCSSLCGPVFGMYDLSINLDNRSACRSNPGRTFSLPAHLSFGSSSALSCLTGYTRSWGSEILEVYVFQV
jgi:hypothetical protein